MPKLYRCPTSSVPRFPCPTVHCTDCSIRPKNSHQKSENHLENHAKNHLNFHAKSVRLYGIVRTIQIRTVQPPTAKKYFSQKFTEKFSRELYPLCCSLSSLKHTQKISLTLLPMCSQHPPDVFTTCLAHYPMHSFII
jgi:hypothetical protein